MHDAAEDVAQAQTDGIVEHVAIGTHEVAVAGFGKIACGTYVLHRIRVIWVVRRFEVIQNYEKKIRAATDKGRG